MLPASVPVFRYLSETGTVWFWPINGVMARGECVGSVQSVPVFDWAFPFLAVDLALGVDILEACSDLYARDISCAVYYIYLYIMMVYLCAVGAS